MTIYNPALALVSLNGSGPVPCEVDARTVNGLKEMTLTAHAPLMEFFAMVVDLRLHVGDHVAEGRGLVASVNAERTIIYVDGPMREVSA